MRSLAPYNIIALDAGYDSIKAVRLRVGPLGAKLAMAESAAVEAGQLDQALGRLTLLKARAQTRVVGLSARKGFYRWLTLPKLASDQIRQAALLELEDALPFSLDDLAAGVLPLGKPMKNSDRPTHLGLALPRERLDAVDRLLREAKRPADVWSLDVVGLLSAAKASGVGSGLVVDIGASKATILCFDQGRPIGLTFINTAGAALDRSLARRNNWTIDRARRFKEEQDHPSAAMDLFLEPLTELAAGINLAVRTCFPLDRSRPEAIHLSGGSAVLPGLDAYLAAELGLPVKRLEPLSRQTPPVAVTAVGLALAGRTFNLEQVDRAGGNSSAAWKWAAVAALIAGLLYGTTLYLDLDQRRQSLAALKKTEIDLFRQHLPHVKRIVSPLVQAETELAKARQELNALTRGRADQSILDVVAILSKLTEAHRVELSELTVEGPEVTAGGTAPNFEALKAFEAALVKQETIKDVVLEQNRLQGGKVRFRIKMKR